MNSSGVGLRPHFRSRKGQEVELGRLEPGNYVKYLEILERNHPGNTMKYLLFIFFGKGLRVALISL